MTEQYTITVTKSFVISGIPVMSNYEKQKLLGEIANSVVIDTIAVTLPGDSEIVDCEVHDTNLYTTKES